MSTNTTSKLEFFVNLFNNIFHRRNLVILIGRNGVLLTAFRNHKVKKTLFLENTAEDFTKTCRKFIRKYKRYHIVFLLDNKECELKHEIMPILSSMIKSNPFDKFIAENYSSTDIVAHNVYEINHQNGEVWNSCIASTPYVPQVKRLLEYVINKTFKYSGAYFLSLESEVIIERVLQRAGVKDLSEALQIFTVITKSSDIRLIVKYKQNIMDEEVIEYPSDKSDSYIQGTIEQAVSEKLLFYKDFVKKIEIKTCAIFLSDEPMKELLGKLEFPDTRIIALSGKDVSNTGNYKDQKFQDNVLLELFDGFNTHLAFNTLLRSITKLSLLNGLIFKPLVVFLLGFMISLGILKYQDVVTQGEAINLNQKYYALSEEYRDIKKRHPDVKNISDLIDLFNLDTLIGKATYTPFEHLKTLYTPTHKNLNISNVSWRVLNPLDLSFDDMKIEIIIDVEYIGTSQSTIKGIEILNSYLVHLKSIFIGYEVSYKRDSKKITQIAKSIKIPAQIILTGKVEEVSDAK